ncbi:YqzH family protein [Niallia sp. 01092]|uniref:YqzH family protein n=1 Tax=unclassified Niallia TaxID=2837522 RepID=UPI003FD107C7
MNKVFINKMIKNALKQYHTESTILNDHDFENMYKKIIYSKKESPEVDIYDLVQDVVYGYITDSPYF